MINRFIFYKYYVDKYKLVEIFCNEIFDLLKIGVKNWFDCVNVDDVFMVIKFLYEILFVRWEEILVFFIINIDMIYLYDDMFVFLKKSFYD